MTKKVLTVDNTSCYYKEVWKEPLQLIRKLPKAEGKYAFTT